MNNHTDKEITLHTPSSTLVALPPQIEPYLHADMPEFMPDVLRLLSLHTQAWAGGLLHQATLYHAPNRYQVEWFSKAPADLLPGGLVGIEWGKHPARDGSMPITRVVPLMIEDASANLFWTCPLDWIGSEETRDVGAELADALNDDFRQVFNALLWQRGNFEPYLMQPSQRSLAHQAAHGGLAHRLATTQLALTVARDQPTIDLQVLLLCGLLFDVSWSSHEGVGLADRVDKQLHECWIKLPGERHDRLRETLQAIDGPVSGEADGKDMPVEARLLLSLESVASALAAAQPLH